MEENMKILNRIGKAKPMIETHEFYKKRDRQLVKLKAVSTQKNWKYMC
jgi:hypothetical protein